MGVNLVDDFVEMSGPNAAAAEHDVNSDTNSGATLATNSGLEFCLQPLLLWNVMLLTLAPESQLASEDFCNDRHTSNELVPAVNGGMVEMIRKMRAELGINSINQCPCGYIYGIGECGQPMETRRCPQCGSPIGGTNHNWATGVNQGTGMANYNDDEKGIPLHWVISGAGYTERDLSPLQYRLLSVLVLFPLAVFSPRRSERIDQLRKHWKELKEVSKLSSDTQAQHWMLGILHRAFLRGPGSVAALAMSGHAWSSSDGRRQAEVQFARELQQVLGADSPVLLVENVQKQLNDLEHTSHPLLELRAALVRGLPDEERAERFAPRVLALVSSARAEVQSAEAAMAQLREQVVQAPDSYPVLVRCLFDADTYGLPEALQNAIDLALPEKLQHLPTLLDAFLRIHVIVDESPAQMLECRAEDIISSLPCDLRGSFESAWEVCRYGQRLGCQYVDDLGELSQLQGKHLVWLRDASGEATPAQTILTSLVDDHNKNVALLLSSSGFDGQAAEAVTSFSVEQVKQSLVEWRAAREWLREAVQPVLAESQWTASFLEGLMVSWLTKGPPHQRLDLTAWPRVYPPRSNILRVTVSKQASTIPDPAMTAFDMWIKRNGALRDHISASLQ